MQPEPMPHGQDKMTKARMFFSDFVKKIGNIHAAPANS